MWKLLRTFCKSRDGSVTQRNRSELGIAQISAVELASLFVQAPDNVMIFDLREPNEVEEHPYGIPGALLTTNVNLQALISWIPPKTAVVLYATADIPPRYALLHLLSTKLRFYALEGGLRSWRKTGLPMEPFVLSDRRSVDNR
jgi:rhodanese-related sulfurtransferase